MIEKNDFENFIVKPTPKKRVSIIKTIAVKERSLLYGTRVINSAELAADLAMELFKYADREMLISASLDSKCQPISLEIVAIGSINTCIVSPREIFKNVILSNAANFIVFHNHPSGDCTPSREDISVTKRLIEVGELMGISLLDHIIIGDESNFCSIREKKLVSFTTIQPIYCK